MKKLLTRNLGLKITSLLFAVALWLVVVNINDPVISRRFSNIPVKLINTEVVTAQDQVYEILDNTDVINTVTVTGQRSVLEGIDPNDIVAVADFDSGMQADGSVAINLSCSRYNSKISSIKGSIDNVRLSVEKKRTIQLVLKATTSGTVADGCLIGNINTDQNLVRIEGPASVVSSITKAAVNVDVSGATSTVATYVGVVLYDAEGNEVSHPALYTNCNQVRVTVEVLGTKEVPLELAVQGTPAIGYLDTGVITAEPELVKICGNTNNLAKVSSIVVPETELNITGQSEDMTVYINLTPYLPVGIGWAESGFDGTVAVTVEIDKAETKTLSISKDSLVVVNVPEGFDAKLEIGDEETKEYHVSVMGLPNVVNAAQDRNIIGYADMNAFMSDAGLSGAEELVPGIYEVELLFNNLGDLKVAVPVKANLIISATESESVD